LKIYLARHGQSHWQVSPSEDWDTGLTETGREQARRLGRWLRAGNGPARGERMEIAELCASPLRRARETADVLANALGLPVLTRPALAEAPFHVSDHLPEAIGPLSQQSPHQPSSEYAAFMAKAQVAWQELVEQADASGGSVLAVTHGGLIKTMLRAIMGSDRISFRIFNTALQVLEWNHGRWYLVHLNMLDHLPIELRT
jgi:probable phosphoglycerate mutase